RPARSFVLLVWVGLDECCAVPLVHSGCVPFVPRARLHFGQGAADFGLRLFNCLVNDNPEPDGHSRPVPVVSFGYFVFCRRVVTHSPTANARAARISSTVITEPRSRHCVTLNFVWTEPAPCLFRTVRVQGNNSRCLPVSECFRYVVVSILIVFNVDIREPGLMLVEVADGHVTLGALGL